MFIIYKWSIILRRNSQPYTGDCWNMYLFCHFCVVILFVMSVLFVILFVMFLSFVLSFFCHLSFGMSFCSSLFVISVKFIGDRFFMCVSLFVMFFFQMLYFYLFLVVACESLQLRCELVRGSWPLCLACGMLAHTSKSVTAMDVVYLLQVMYAIQCSVFKRMYCI
jgi:hypothetical protein